MVTPDSLSVRIQNLLQPYGNMTSLPHPQAQRCEVVINGLLIYSTPSFISATGGMRSTYSGFNSVILIVVSLFKVCDQGRTRTCKAVVLLT